MNQDQLIRFLMDNIDVDALVSARNNGASIMYFAGVAQRFPNAQNVNPTRQTTPTRQPQRITPQPQAEDRPPRYGQTVETAPVENLTEEAPAGQPNTTAPINRTAPRNNPTRNVNNQNTDRVRVSRL